MNQKKNSPDYEFLLNSGLTPEEIERKCFDCNASVKELAEAVRNTSRSKPASEFGEDYTKFLWFPYLPIGDYTVLMADGGTGKTIFCCGIAAALSNGDRLPGELEKRVPAKTLFISAEDRGELLKRRLTNCGADLENVLICDCTASEGMNFTENIAEFEDEIKRSNARLVIVDPWHAFLGESIDINRVNAVRPVFQSLANMAKRCACALVLVSHVNKRAQGENANNAATGSTDFINAARSAIRVVFDDEDENRRIAVHTKSNYAAVGKSLIFRIVDGGLEWDGFSEITRSTLEESARKKTTLSAVQRKQYADETTNDELIRAIIDEAPDCYSIRRMTYDEMRANHGAGIFGADNKQPKRALDSIAGKLLTEHGIIVQTGKTFNIDGVAKNGFIIRLTDAEEAETLESIIKIT